MSNRVIGVALVAGLLIIAALIIGADIVRNEGWSVVVEFLKATAYVLLVAAWATLFVVGLQMAFTGAAAPYGVAP
jgi:UPF0716 family protein affecting phage T7 exclusion